MVQLKHCPGRALVHFSGELTHAEALDLVPVAPERGGLRQRRSGP